MKRRGPCAREHSLKYDLYNGCWPIVHVERRSTAPCGRDILISLDIGTFESGVGGVDRVVAGLRLWSCGRMWFLIVPSVGGPGLCLRPGLNRVNLERAISTKGSEFRVYLTRNHTVVINHTTCDLSSRPACLVAPTSTFSVCAV